MEVFAGMSPNATRQVPLSPSSCARTPRAEHIAFRASNISNGALRVLYRLNEPAIQAFLVGGAVRDLLLGGHPKDFDVATNATPEEVHEPLPQLPADRAALPPCACGVRARDRRSRDVPRHQRRRQRRSPPRRWPHRARQRVGHDRGRCACAATSRVNALYYDIADFSVRDYVGGMQDLEQRTPAPDRRSRAALSRRSGTHAARGAPGGQARFHDRTRNRRAVRATRPAAGRRAAGAAVRRIA